MRVNVSYLWGILTFSYLVGGTAFAADLKKNIAKCAQILGALERLECFDALAHTQGVDKPKDVTPAIGGKGKWEVSVESNPVDDTKTVTLTLMSDGARSRWGNPVGLAIRCKSNETNFFIAWQDYLGRKATVLTRLGQEKAVTSEWSLSTDSKATFYPGSPISYIKQMMANSSFVAQVTPYNESPVTATFDIKGLENAVKPLRETCHWE